MESFSIWLMAIFFAMGVLPAFLPLLIKKPEGRNRYGSMPKPMGFFEAIQSCFGQFVSAHGRASRSEFWYFFLFTVIFDLLLLVIIEITKLDFLNLLSYVVAIPSLMVSIRRLHDINRTGWWMLIQFGLGVITLIILWAQPSDKDTRHLEDVF